MFERPEYAVLGRRQYDQRWIDGNVEAGVGACGWPRPGARPPALDTAPGARRAAPAATPAKRPGIVRRAVRRVLHRAPAAPDPRPYDLGEPPLPATMQPAVVPEPEAEPEPEPPPKPQEPVDELLSPASPVPPQTPKRRCILGGVFCR